jgi:hypothetical protein
MSAWGKRELSRIDDLIRFYEKLVNDYPDAVSYADTRARLVQDRVKVVNAIGRKKCQSNTNK